MKLSLFLTKVDKLCFGNFWNRSSARRTWTSGWPVRTSEDLRSRRSWDGEQQTFMKSSSGRTLPNRYDVRGEGGGRVCSKMSSDLNLPNCVFGWWCFSCNLIVECDITGKHVHFLFSRCLTGKDLLSPTEVWVSSRGKCAEFPSHWKPAETVLLLVLTPLFCVVGENWIIELYRQQGTNKTFW